MQINVESFFWTSFNNPAKYAAFLDFNGDGIINTADNLQFQTARLRDATRRPASGNHIPRVGSSGSSRPSLVARLYNVAPRTTWPAQGQ